MTVPAAAPKEGSAKSEQHKQLAGQTAPTASAVKSEGTAGVTVAPPPGETRKKVFFYAGAHGISTPFYGSDGISVHAENKSGLKAREEFVVMAPWRCGGGPSFFGSNLQVPTPTLDATGLTKEEILAVLNDTDEVLLARSSCCWKFGYLGPIAIALWWIDAILAQCKSGIVRLFCVEPALSKVEAILKRHNEENLNSKGCTVSMIRGHHRVETYNGGFTHKMYFPTWILQFACNDQLV